MSRKLNYRYGMLKLKVKITLKKKTGLNKFNKFTFQMIRNKLFGRIGNL